MAEIDEKVQKLKVAIDKALANPAWKSLPDGTTHCNGCTSEIADGLGVPDLKGEDGQPLMAEEMGRKILAKIEDAKLTGQPCDWRQDTAARAVAHAKKGGFGFGWSPKLSADKARHNHVVVPAPEDMAPSGTYGCDVPMVASIAPYPFVNRVMKTSEAYRKENAPIWLLYKSDQDV